MEEHTTRGHLELCLACRAQAVFPFPPSWCVDLIKRGPMDGPVRMTIMPHKLGCIMQPLRFGPNEGASVRIPGYMVTSLAFFEPGETLD